MLREPASFAKAASCFHSFEPAFCADFLVEQKLSYAFGKNLRATPRHRAQSGLFELTQNFLDGKLEFLVEKIDGTIDPAPLINVAR